MGTEVKRDMFRLREAAAVLELTPEAIRQRIINKKIQARYDRGSAKLGYIIERDEFIRYLRSIGEDERAKIVERGAYTDAAAK